MIITENPRKEVGEYQEVGGLRVPRDQRDFSQAEVMEVRRSEGRKVRGGGLGELIRLSGHFLNRLRAP